MPILGTISSLGARAYGLSGSKGPDAPTLTQTNSANGDYTLSTSAYSFIPSAHSSTDWEITLATDTSFSSPIYQSLLDTSNKTSISLQDKSLPDGNQLIARARHIATNGARGEWSTSYIVYTPPSTSFSSTSIDHTHTVSSYTNLTATHNSSDYALTTTADTSFASTAYSQTSQSASSYTNTKLLQSSSNYLVRVRANFSDGRSSPYKISTRTTSSYTYTITYTSNTTITTPFTATSNGSASINVYVECAGGKGNRPSSNRNPGCNSSGRGKKFGMTLSLTGNTQYYAYPNGVAGGNNASCSANGGGNAAVFATTSNGAYLIAGGGGGVRQSCHDCSQPLDGCGGGAGSTSAGGGNCGTCCGCGTAGSTWGGSRLGSGSSTDTAETGYNPSSGETGCGGGNSWSFGSLSLNSWNNGDPYVYISWS